ncbi:MULTISPECIES: hypothetical protein [Actinosynnema]|uniref:hypothetical protein n=1 Tax=Actinosynnema TaxID=40566 RepID=UPI0020A554B1|nr:hypothetical protein [Actinosynnema pretiosum]MCP2098443.1 Bacterial PH domain [Actinosynnema pretiosum]
MRQDLGAVKHIFKRKGEAAFGKIDMVVLSLGTVFLLVKPPDNAGCGTVVLWTTICTAFIWIAWLSTVRPVVELRERGAVVVNWFFRSEIPWNAVVSVEVASEVGSGVALLLRVELAAVSPSGANAMMGFGLQNRVRLLIEQMPKEGSEGLVVRSKFDVDPIPFLFAMVVLIALGWFMLP